MPFTMQAHTKMQEDDMSRARQLGVSDAALSASRRIMVEPRDILAMGDSTLRVLQWNVLADGLSGDGFLVQDVLDLNTAPHHHPDQSRKIWISQPISPRHHDLRD